MESYAFECSTCRLSITGYTNYQRHVNSVEHANLVQMKTSNNNVTDEEKAHSATEYEEPTSSFSSIGLACDLCKKTFSGNEPYQQHLVSAGHKKKVEGLASQNIELRCNICNKDFSGKVPYEQHIVSKAHLKKAVQSDMDSKSFPNFLAEHQTEFKSKDNSHPLEFNNTYNSIDTKPITTENGSAASVIPSQLFFSCDVCDSRFSGPVPYQQHLESKGHKKKVEATEMLKKIQNLSSLSKVDSVSNQDRIDGNKTYCKSSPTLFDEHQTEVKSRDNSHPMEYDSTYSSTDTKPTITQNGSTVSGIASQLLFSCDVCDSRFSGPVPYQQHLVSKGHKKKVQDIEMRKRFQNLSSLSAVDSSSIHDRIDKSETNNKSSLTSFDEYQTEVKSKDNSHPMEYDSTVVCMTQHSSTDTKLITTEDRPTASVHASQLLAICNICDDRFSGPVPYPQHFESEGHKKKVRDLELQKMFQNSSTASSSEINNTKSPFLVSSQTHPFRCADCDKNFNGSVPYDQHMKSAVHLKKMLQKNRINGDTNFGSFPSPPKCDVPNSEKYFCKMCNKQCSGTIPFTQHIMSEAHGREVQIYNYNKQLNDLSKSNGLGMEDDKMSIDDNCANEKSNLLLSSELSFTDAFKEVNHLTPDNLNVTTFGVSDNIVF